MVSKLKIFHIFFGFIVFGVLMLSPYLEWPVSFVAGQWMAAAVLVFFSTKIFIFKKFALRVNKFFIIILISLMLYPCLVGMVAYQTIDAGLLKMNLSVIVMISIGAFVTAEYSRKLDFTYLVTLIAKLYICVIALNSVIIIFEYLDPSFRVLVESFLRAEMKTDYLGGFRYRGIASAGGANLSIAHGVAGVISLLLWKNNQLSGLSVLVTVILTFSSLVFIGRTGFVILAFGSLLVMVTRGSRNYSMLSQFFGVVVLTTMISFMLNYLLDDLPIFYKIYSIDLFSNGIQGFQDEGTFGAVFNFYNFPDHLPKLLFGVGNFSGGYELGYAYPSDPGFVKMATAYGFIITPLLYCGLFLWIYAAPRGLLRSIIMLLFLILMVGELKEPFLLKGYSSRLFWFMVGVMLQQQNRLLRMPKRKTRWGDVSF